MTTVPDLQISHVPVVTERPEPAERVIVGVDGSPASIAALRWAARQADRSGAELEAVFVYEPTPSLGFSFSGYPAVNPVDPHRAERRAHDALEQIVIDALGPDHGARLVTLADSSPAAGLTRVSEGAAMLVVGAHRHAMKDLLLGSTSAACVKRAVTPVVVVPAAPPAPAG